MTAILILVAFVAVTSAGGAIWFKGHEAGTLACEQGHKDAEAKAKAQADAEIAKATKEIEKREAVASAKEQEAAKRQITIVMKGEQNAKSDKGLNATDCVMSANSLQFYRGALAGMRAAANTSIPEAAVPGPDLTGEQRRDVPKLLPASTAPTGAVGTVHPSIPATAGDGGLQRQHLPEHPKPKPVQ